MTYIASPVRDAPPPPGWWGPLQEAWRKFMRSKALEYVLKAVCALLIAFALLTIGRIGLGWWFLGSVETWCAARLGFDAELASLSAWTATAVFGAVLPILCWGLIGRKHLQAAGIMLGFQALACALLYTVGREVCFDRRSGAPLCYYADTPAGRVFSHTAGADPKFGIPFRLYTSEVAVETARHADEVRRAQSQARDSVVLAPPPDGVPPMRIDRAPTPSVAPPSRDSRVAASVPVAAPATVEASLPVVDVAVALQGGSETTQLRSALASRLTLPFEEDVAGRARVRQRLLIAVSTEQLSEIYSQPRTSVSLTWRLVDTKDGHSVQSGSLDGMTANGYSRAASTTRAITLAVDSMLTSFRSTGISLH